MYVSSDLRPHVEAFKEAYELSCGGTLEFPEYYKIETATDLYKNRAGVCVRLPGMFLIKIDRDGWEHSDQHEKMQVMFHELSHCLLKEDHSKNSSNYMYYKMNDLVDEEVVRQTFVVMRRHCSND